MSLARSRAEGKALSPCDALTTETSAANMRPPLVRVTTVRCVGERVAASRAGERVAVYPANGALNLVTCRGVYRGVCCVW